MPNPTIAIPVLAPDEVEELLSLRSAARRVHKSVPAHSPVRQASADLNGYLYRLNRRGIPLKMLASLVGLSHQAVRVRVRTASHAEARPASSDTSALNGVPKLSEPTPDVVLVADAGVHRRLHVYDPPDSVGPAQLAMLPEMPLLARREHAVIWLETQEEHSARKSASASPLRVPPVVYLSRDVVETVLVPLTTEE